MAQLDYFDALYANNADPWCYQTRWYEQRKRAISIAVLPQSCYSTAIELGCGNGIFSEQLSQRCSQLLCLDGNSQAVNLAQQRLKNLSHICVKQAKLPQELPHQNFDLIVISEILYYLNQNEIQTVIEWVRTTLKPYGTLLCCHWRYPIGGFEQTGETVHRLLQATFDHSSSEFLSQVRLHDADFVLDVWQKNLKTVAQQEGLI